MKGKVMKTWTERWLRTVLRFYPRDFREEMGDDIVATYRAQCDRAWEGGGVASLVFVWLRALVDSARNGLAERVRPGIRWRRSGDWGRDGQLVLRRLVRAPVFLITMVGTLTAGLGGFAVVYTVVDRVLLAPLPYENADDLYYVWREYGWFDLDRGALSGPDVAQIGELDVIEHAVAVARRRSTISGSGTAEPREIDLATASAGFLQLLRAQPAVGRDFDASEHGPGRPLVVILGHELWRTQFHSDPSVVGREVRLDGDPATVIGVMGPEFRFLLHAGLGAPQTVDAFTSMDIDLGTADPFGGSHAGIIRVREGTPPAVVSEAVEAVGAAVNERVMDGRGLRLYPVQMKEDLVAPVRQPLMVLGAAGVLLLLVLLVNLATLLLARAAQREREFAVARALGANNVAIIRATLLEGGALGLLGGVGGALAAVWGARVLAAMAPLDLPRRQAIEVTPGIALTVIAIGALLGLLAGILPASWSARSRLDSLLGAASVRGGGGHGRLRRSMVVVQVALSLVLLSAGGLVARSFGQLLEADPGFEPGGALTMRIAVPQGLYTDAVPALHERIHETLASVPGVTHVGATTVLPLSSGTSQRSVSFPGAPGNTGDPDHDVQIVDRTHIRPGYFAAVGARMIAGSDLDDAPPEGVDQVVIDRTLAEQFYAGSDAVGATLMFGETPLRVVGVVEHIRLYDVHAEGYPQIYVRNGFDRLVSAMSWVIRTPRSPGPVYSEIGRALRTRDPELAISEAQPLAALVSDAVREQRMSATLIGGFALGALLLAAMGLFGVVAGSVTRRRHELAIRLALGADHRRVLRTVIGEGALLTGLGLLLGVPGIYVTGQIVRGVLVGVSPFDPVTLGAVSAGLATVALLACYLPARRVLKIAPAQSLRQE
jgi:putative ABC transport system permease protein